MANEDQAEFWTGQREWANQQVAMDACMAPALEMVIAQAALQPGEQVLDIGCGTGASLLAAAAQIGATGHVTGADISPTLLALARERCAEAHNVTIHEADAQEADLGAGYDAVISRFGVMFFEDTPAAFANIARACKPGARLSMIAWGDVADNPWFMAPAAAVRRVLGPQPKVDRSLPGPFAFEHADRVLRDLRAAGLADVTVTAQETLLTPPGGVAENAELCTRIGPAAGAIRANEANTEQVDALRAAIAQEFASFDTADGLRVPAKLNLISARVA